MAASQKTLDFIVLALHLHHSSSHYFSSSLHSSRLDLNTDMRTRALSILTTRQESFAINNILQSDIGRGSVAGSMASSREARNLSGRGSKTMVREGEGVEDECNEGVRKEELVVDAMCGGTIQKYGFTCYFEGRGKRRRRGGKRNCSVVYGDAGCRRSKT